METLPKVLVVVGSQECGCLVKHLQELRQVVTATGLDEAMQAMREIWHASRNPHAGPDDQTPTLIGAWWTLWLVTNFLGQLSLRYTIRAETPQAMVAAEVISSGSGSAVRITWRSASTTRGWLHCPGRPMLIE